MVTRVRATVIVAATLCICTLAGCPQSFTGTGAGSGSAGLTSDDAADLVERLVDDPNVLAAAKFAGDAIVAQRAIMPTLCPELSELVSGGSKAAEAILAKLAGSPSYEQDANLFLLAYALEQIDYAPGLDQLVSFLEDNVTGEVPMTLATVTHAVRGMLGLSLNDSASYLASEIEDTIEVAGGSPADGESSRADVRKSCWREFTLLDSNDRPLVYPSGHSKAGQIIRVGGTIQPADITLPESKADDERNRVDRGGGTYVDFTDPHYGVTFQGQPTRTFNCAGFAFRQFNDGMKWNADPASWFDAMRAAGKYEKVTSDGDAAAGNFVFYFGQANLPAHVAVVQSNSLLSGITVINADRWSGLFTANADAAYFFGNWYRDFGFGLERRYERREVWRWKPGVSVLFEPYTDRSRANSCHGEDEDGDGYPESPACSTTSGRCIDPEFASGESGTGDETDTPGYRVYIISQIGPGQLEVLAAGSENDELPLCRFAGGGLDCSVMADLSPFTESFSTKEEAVRSLCGRATDIKVFPLGVGPGCDIDGTSRFLSWEVYNILTACGS